MRCHVEKCPNMGAAALPIPSLCRDGSNSGCELAKEASTSFELPHYDVIYSDSLVHHGDPVAMQARLLDEGKDL